MNQPYCPARSNPFATEHLERLTFRFPCGQNWEQRLAELARTAFRGAIIGPEGSGKTTLLLELRQRLEEAGYASWMRRVPLGRQPQQVLLAELAQLPPSTVVLLDSAELLGFWQWRRLRNIMKSKNLGLVVTAHKPCPIATWVETQTSLDLLTALLTELGVDTRNSRHQKLIAVSFAKHRGNIRETFLDLYDYATP